MRICDVKVIEEGFILLLYNFVEDEFELLCSEAESLLDWQEFVNVYESFDKEDWTDERKRSELSENCLILNEKPTSSEK